MPERNEKKILNWCRQRFARRKEPVRLTPVREITVRLDDCEVVSNRYFEEVPRSGGRIQQYDQLYDQLSGGDRSVQRVEVNRSRLKYTDPETGETYFSQTITKDIATLKFKMWDVKQTAIRFFEDGNYFFDLGFLD